MVFLSQLPPNDSDERERVEELLASQDAEPLTPEEIRAQRVSFVMGMLPHDTTMTRDQVKEILEKHYG